MTPLLLLSPTSLGVGDEQRCRLPRRDTPSSALNLPPDAQPIGRPCTVIVEPEEDGWTVIECSDSGAGMLGHSLSKRAAILIALEFVERWNAELTLKNNPAWSEA